MKKIFSILLFVMITFSFCSCAKVENYEFLHNSDEIKEIELVMVTENPIEEIGDEIVVFETATLAKITDIDMFLADFSTLTCIRMKLAPAVGILAGYNAIKLTYSNGDIEFIGALGQVYLIDGVYIAGESNLCFSDDDLNRLIAAYVAHESKQTNLDF